MNYKERLNGVLAGSILLLTGISFAPATSQAVELRMHQQVDKECNQNLQQDVLEVEPGECIAYQVRVVNLKNFDARNVEVYLSVPEYTHIQDYPVVIGEKDLHDKDVSITWVSSTQQYKVSIPVLQQGEDSAFIIGYSVRVRE